MEKSEALVKQGVITHVVIDDARLTLDIADDAHAEASADYRDGRADEPFGYHVNRSPATHLD